MAAGGEEAAKLLESEGAVAPQAQTSRRFRAAALLTAGSAGVWALAVVASRRAPRSGAPETGVMQASATWVQDFHSSCGSMDVDYHSVDDSGWGTGIDHIPTPEMCCALCQGNPKCKSFTWMKDALPDGQCWLKGGVGKKSPQVGSVYGTPPTLKTYSKPSKPAKAAGASMYCFALMVPGTEEQKLLTFQKTSGISIFACDAYAVFTNKTISFSGVTTRVIESDLTCGYGGDSGTALNSWIFIALFAKLLDDGVWAKHDWSVKVDPDAVFFPDRLVPIVREHQGVGYINNCKYGMHGPIEVFGKKALEALDKDYKASWDGKAPTSCVNGMDFGLWGEDMFINQCLSKILKVGPVPLDERLMCEDHCDCPDWFWCTNGTDRVSFHPFKTVDSYKNCVANAIGFR